MNLRPVSIRVYACYCFCFWLALGVFTHLSARAGGAGGHSSGGHSSGGGGFGGGSSYHGSGGYGSDNGGSSPFGLGFIILIIIVYVIYYIIKSRMDSASEVDSVELGTPAIDRSSLGAFLAGHPDFDVVSFNAKVRMAFLKIQAAWSAQNISEVRPFISDGIYQRFATQFRMMGLLKQQNRLDEIEILGVQLVSAREDGPFDVIDVQIQAAMHDSFVCELDHSLDSESDDSFIEYWSFIRKRGAVASGFNGFEAKTCPSCGGALPLDMGELCRCSYCQVIFNNGDFDWILAEITQEADYAGASVMAANVSPELEDSVAALAPQCADFSVQLAEDKASNAFMQIMTAIATRNPASVRRFVSDEMFAKISAMIPKGNVIFNRIYLNEAVLLDVVPTGPKHQLSIGLSASLQRVELLPNKRLSPQDDEEIRENYALTMERDADAVQEKGSLYQHQCPTCGGAVGDTVNVNCQYCGTPLNSTRNEWIVCGFEAPHERAGN